MNGNIDEYRLAINAFRDVLLKRQSNYRKVIEWLDARTALLKGREGLMSEKTRGVLR